MYPKLRNLFLVLLFSFSLLGGGKAFPKAFKFIDNEEKWCLEIKKIIRKKYAKEIESSKKNFPESTLKIEIGTRYVDGCSSEVPVESIIFQFEHPYFCNKDGCSLLGIKINKSGKWVEYLNAVSNGRIFIDDVVRYEGDNASIDWCIDSITGGQVYGWKDGKLSLLYKDKNIHCGGQKVK